MKTLKHYLLFALVAVFFSCNSKQIEDNPVLADAKKEIVDALRTYSGLSTYAKELDNMEFDIIKDVTVFAATDDVYTKSDTKNTCDVYIGRHIVEGKYVSAALTDSMQLHSLDGTILLVTIIDGRIYINGVELVDEIPAGNNVVYIVESAICTETIAPEQDVPVTGLRISQPSLSLEVGKTELIAVFVEPAGAKNPIITWQCDKDGLVEVKPVTDVDSIFSITAIAKGTVNITFSTVEGGYSATCIVTVSDGFDEDEEKTDDNNNVVIETMDYSFKAPCTLLTSQLIEDSVYIINSTEALRSFISCEEAVDSDIDFDRFSLLFVHGRATSGINSITKTLLQISPVEFTLNVELNSGMTTEAPEWNIVVLTQKISQNVNVRLKKTVN